MIRPLLLLALCVPGSVLAQGGAAPPAPDPQIAAAIAPLPESFRATATVLGYVAGRPGLSPLRQGQGPYVCLADDPSDERFHVACYHREMEPFMARGRELRAQGHTADVDSVRYAEVRAGRLAVPTRPAALYSLSGHRDSVTVAGSAVTGARRLYVVYIPFATSESTGLPTQPAQNAPWLMFPGTPKAHIMFIPSM